MPQILSPKLRSKYIAMSDVLERTVQKCGEDKNIIGAAVFGSFVTGGITEESDLDLLIIRSDDAKFKKAEREIQGIRLESNVWSRSVFEKSFTVEGTNLGQDGFVFEVMRTCRILHDSFGLLARLKEYAVTHTIPEGCITPVLKKAHERLDRARNLLNERQLEAAELEARMASEDIVSISLVRQNITKIIVPKLYLPQLRSHLPKLYEFFRGLHRLEVISREDVEDAINMITEWRERCLSEIKLRGREDWFNEETMQGGATRGAATELRNAIDCLRAGDLEAALMQARYSAILLTSPVVLLNFNTRGRPSERLLKLVSAGDTYMDSLRRVMKFRNDGNELSRLIHEAKEMVCYPTQAHEGNQ